MCTVYLFPFIPAGTRRKPNDHRCAISWSASYGGNPRHVHSVHMGWLPREALWNRMITRICNEVIFSFYPSVQEPGYHVLQQLPERVQHEGNCSGAADLMSKGHEGLHVGLIEGGGEVAEGRSWIRTSHPSYCRSGTSRGSAEYHCCPAGSMGKHTAISFPKVRLLLSLSRSTMKYPNQASVVPPPSEQGWWQGCGSHGRRSLVVRLEKKLEIRAGHLR